jgi:hypothetical protein
MALLSLASFGLVSPALPPPPPPPPPPPRYDARLLAGGVVA